MRDIRRGKICAGCGESDRRDNQNAQVDQICALFGIDMTDPRYDQIVDIVSQRKVTE